MRQQDMFVTARTETKRQRETSQGLETHVRWKDGSTTWITLKGMSETYSRILSNTVLNRVSGGLFLHGGFQLCANVAKSSSIGCKPASS
jgi:hypothetical protein